MLMRKLDSLLIFCLYRSTIIWLSAIKETLMAVESLKSPMFNNLKENKDGFKVAIEKCQNLSEVLAKAKGLVAE